MYVDGYKVFEVYHVFNSGGIKLVYGDPANEPGVPIPLITAPLTPIVPLTTPLSPAPDVPTPAVPEPAEPAPVVLLALVPVLVPVPTTPVTFGIKAAPLSWWVLTTEVWISS